MTKSIVDDHEKLPLDRQAFLTILLIFEPVFVWHTFKNWIIAYLNRLLYGQRPGKDIKDECHRATIPPRAYIIHI